MTRKLVMEYSSIFHPGSAKSLLRRWLAWLLLAAPLAAWAQNAPTISIGPTSVTIHEDTSTNFTFTVSDGDGGAAGLSFIRASSNAALVPTNNVVVSGTGATQTVTVTPLADQNGTATIAITVVDGDGQASDSFTLTVNAVNDPPSVTGTLLGTAANPILEGATKVALFSNLTVGDVDQGKPGNEDLTVTVYPDANFPQFGSFQGTELIQVSGTPSQVTTSLRAFRFNANPNISSGSFSLAVVACDGSNACATNLGTVYLESVNQPPVIGATLAPSQIRDDQDVLPFFLSIDDPDPPVPGEQFVVLIEPVNDTNFTYGALVPARPQFTGSVATVQAQVRTVEYRPVRDSVATSQVVQFRVRVRDGAGAEATDTVSLTILGVNDSPSISGVALNIIRLTDDPAKPLVRPFSTVRIVDVDEGGQQLLRVTLSVDDPAKGSLIQSNLALFGPQITIANTAAQVTAAIATITFLPNQRTNRTVGETVTAQLGIRVVDSLNAASEDNRTTLAITSVNGSPLVLLNGSPDFPPLSQPLRIPPSAAIRPFSGVVIQDDDQTNVTVTLLLDDPNKGELTTLGGFQVVTSGVSRVYRIVANPIEATRALTNLVFVINTHYLFPANAPGGTVFTIQAVDSVLNTTTRLLPIEIQDQPRNHFVTEDSDELYPPNHPVVAERGRPKLGTLRRAIQDANNNDAITFALPQYRSLIRLDENLGPLELVRNLSLKGPGADLLTISGDTDGDGVPDTQLLRVRGSVVIEGVTLTKGRDRALTGAPDEAITGGAVFVGPAGYLWLRSCAVTESLATQWGGAIDVMQGGLTLEQCLVRGNQTDESLGQGGGAISLYTDRPCAFVNSTFSSNRQASANGFGGGAIYAENYALSTEFAVTVTHCTFAENLDVADLGSSLSANAFGTLVTLRNNVFADGQGRNLEVQGAARIVSQGGNVADDSTRTTLVQAGQPKSVILLSAGGDLADADLATLLSPALTDSMGPTPAYPLVAGSPAIGRAVGTPEGTDQRGVIRDHDPDAGALEYEVFERVVINEIHFQPNPALTNDTAFIELYVPRDSTPIGLSNFSLWINGTNRCAFAPTNQVRPGQGLLVADRNLTLDPTNNPTRMVLASPGPLALTNLALVEVRRDGRTVASATYLGVFADPNNATNTLNYSFNSLTLVPQFRGFAWVPHGVVLPSIPAGAETEGVNLSQTGPRTSPAKDTRNAPFGLRNAFPLAGEDVVVVGEDDLFMVDVLANDQDADRLDVLFVVDVSRTSGAGTGNAATANSVQGARVSISPAAAPLRGTAVWFDPRTTTNLQQLPEGARVTDQFYYEITDMGAGPILAYTNGNGGVVVLSPNHRLTNGELVVITGSEVAAYNATHTVTNVTDDACWLALAFQTNPPVKGSWTTRNPRLGTVRAEGKVTLTVLGANDPPTPANDQVATDEETILRIMAAPTLAGNQSVVFDTDAQYPPPRTNSPVSLLPNDDDPDTDDDATTLRVVGVLGEIHPIASYDGTAGLAPVIVRAPGHGLADGTEILISGYGGHPSYNGLHLIAVRDADSFSIPVRYVDNHSLPGWWGILDDAGRLSAISAYGATVHLEIRTDWIETSIVYNPRASTNLNALALGQTANDLFFYAVEDRHGAVSFAQVVVAVTGVNDAPVPVADPRALGGYTPLLGAGQSLADAVGESQVRYFLPPASGATNRADAPAQFVAGGTTHTLVLGDLWLTDERTPITLATSDLLGNDRDVDTNDVLRIKSVSASSAAQAAVSLSGDGRIITYDPSGSARLDALAREELLLDTFTVTVTDDRGAEVTSLVAVLVVGINDTPIARDDYAETFRNSPVLFNPILHPLDDPMHHDVEFDVDGSAPDDRLVALPVTEAPTAVPGAQVTIAGNVLTYNPTNAPFLRSLPLGDTWVDAFEYTVVDSSFLFANDDSFKVAADGSGYLLNVLANDRNLARTGMPIQGFSGTVGQTPVTVLAPGHGLSSGMTVAIAEYGGAGLYSRVHVVTVVDPDHFTVPAVFLDDPAQKGFWTRLKIVGVSAPNHRGTVAFDSSPGSILYTPEVNFVGDETFTYQIEDSQGLTDSAVVTVQAIVNQLNGNLQANDDFFSVAKGQMPLLDVLANDNLLPAPGAALKIARIVSPPSPDLAIVGNRIQYTPQPAGAYPFTRTFAYEVSGGGTARAIAEVTIQVIDREGTLDIRNDAFSVTPGSVDNPLNVLANDNILPGSTAALSILSVWEASTSPQGQVTTNANGTGLLYTPNPGFVGQDTLIYVATDGLGGTGTGTVTVAVGALTASPDYFVVSTNAVTLLDVVANDLVLQSGGGTVTLHSVLPQATSLGTMSVQAGGSRLRFASGALGGETNFTYVITDGTGWATGRLTLVVFDPGTGEAVRASPDYFSVLVDSAANALEVLPNDLAIPNRGRPLTIVGIGTGANAPNRGGSVLLNDARDGLIYTPAAGFSGEETFTYTMTDSRKTDTAKVVVKVTSGALLANDDAFTVFFDPVEIARPDPTAFTLFVLANDRVLPDAGQILTITGVGIDDINATNAPSQRGQVSISADGSALVYVPRDADGPFPYVERFTYEISDGTARRAQAQVAVTVERRTGARDLETNDDAYTVQADSVNNTLTVLANDNIKPATAAGWIITGVSAPAFGGVAVISGSVLLYTPKSGFVGTETFTCFVSDGLGGTGESAVTVKVGDLPVCPDRFAALEGSRANPLDVLANDAVRSATASDFLLWMAHGANRGGTVAVTNGLVLYSPAPSYTGEFPYTESFVYMVRDDSGLTVTGKVAVTVFAKDSDRSTAVVRITVIGINDPPVITGTVPGQRVYHRASLRLFSGVTIADRDLQAQQPLTVTVTLDDASHGVLTSLGGFADQGGGVYRLASATPAAATAAVRGLIFVPTTGSLLSPDVTETTRFTLSVNDQVAGPASDSNTTVTAYHPQMTSVTPSDRINDSLFGFALATTRDLAVVGAPRDSRTASSGSVYLYARSQNDQWTEVCKLVSPDPNAGDEFGFSAAISGDVIAVGARYDDQRAANAGAVYIFVRDQGGANQWGFVKKLMASDGASEDQFGYVVALDGDTLVVGSVFDDDRGVNSGSAYVYGRNQDGANQWGLVKKLVASDGATDDQFGLVVAISGDAIAVGAPFHDARGLNAGAVFVFGRHQGGANQWGLLQKALAADAAVNDQFGYAVAMDQQTLVVGAPLDDSTLADVGSVYVFQGGQPGTNPWVQAKKLVPSDGSAQDHFGAAVAVENDYVVVGSPLDDDTRTDAGSIYVFDRLQGGANQWGQIEKLVRAGTIKQFGDRLAFKQGSLAVSSLVLENSAWLGSVTMHRLFFNNAPHVASPIPDQVIPIHVPFSYTLPEGTFASADVRDGLGYAARQSDGSALPAWLQFDPLTRRFSGTPTQLGTVALRVTATDADGESATDSFDIVVLRDAYDIWRHQFFSPEELLDPTLELTRWGDHANPDFDDLDNLAEFGAGTNPLNGNSTNASSQVTITLSIQAVPGGQYVRVTYVRPANDPTTHYSLQVSTNLVNWQPGDGFVESQSTVAMPGGWEAVSLNVRMSALPSSRANFFRVWVTR